MANNLAEKLDKMNDREYAIFEIYGHIESIINNCDRMTSGNFMHNKNSCKLSAKIIKDRLEFLGLKSE